MGIVDRGDPRTGGGRLGGWERRLTLGLLAVALLTGGPAGAAGQALVIVGSGNMSGFLTEMAEAFAGSHPDLRIAVEARTSSAGPPALLRARATLASMSRVMNEDERTAFRRVLGAEAVAHAVGIDALSVFVNQANPLESLSLEQVDAIFSTTLLCGAPTPILRWTDLGLSHAGADRKIGLYGHVPSAGTHAFFKQRALCGGRFRDDIRVQPGAVSAVLSIVEAPAGIGYGATADLRAGIKALAIASAEGEPPARAVADDVYAGRYPLARDLLLYRRPGDDGLAADFVRFALSEAGQQAVVEAGFFALPDARLARERASLP